jgi:hypothetical protein
LASLVFLADDFAEFVEEAGSVLLEQFDILGESFGDS